MSNQDSAPKGEVMSSKPATMPTFTFISPGVVSSLCKAQHSEYLQDTGLVDFVLGVRWDCKSHSKCDMIDFIQNFDNKESETWVHGRRILLNMESVKKTFKLETLGVSIEQKVVGYNPWSFAGIKKNSNSSYSLQSCKDPLIRERLEFQLGALHFKGSRTEVSCYQAKLAEESSSKKNWGDYFGKRLIDQLRKAQEQLSRGNMSYTCTFGSHLQVLLSDQLCATTCSPSLQQIPWAVSTQVGTDGETTVDNCPGQESLTMHSPIVNDDEDKLEHGAATRIVASNMHEGNSCNSEGFSEPFLTSGQESRDRQTKSFVSGGHQDGSSLNTGHDTDMVIRTQTLCQDPAEVMNILDLEEAGHQRRGGEFATIGQTLNEAESKTRTEYTGPIELITTSNIELMAGSTEATLACTGNEEHLKTSTPEKTFSLCVETPQTPSAVHCTSCMCLSEVVVEMKRQKELQKDWNEKMVASLELQRERNEIMSTNLRMQVEANEIVKLKMELLLQQNENMAAALAVVGANVDILKENKSLPTAVGSQQTMAPTMLQNQMSSKALPDHYQSKPEEERLDRHVPQCKIYEDSDDMKKNLGRRQIMDVLNPSCQSSMAKFKSKTELDNVATPSAKGEGSDKKSSMSHKRMRQDYIGIQPPKLITRPVVKKGPNGPISVRRETKKWSKEETNCLIRGVQRFGQGKWSNILEAEGKNFNDRSEIDLKDKWRNLQKKDMKD